MKKMNIRQAHAKLKKMFPDEYVSTKKEITYHSSFRKDGTEFVLYTSHPKPTRVESTISFEEAIEKLKENINDI